ncbi:Nucleotidase YfbR [Klebsiella pneumoniae]|nr:Nucleotidase YfbR [Klebsiella pneumoniae]
MSQSHFFAHLSRLKLINRWPLMRNVRTENVSEHRPAGGDGRPRAGGD